MFVFTAGVKKLDDNSCNLTSLSLNIEISLLPSSFGIDISVLKSELQFDVGSGVDKLIWIYVIDEQALVL